MSTLQIARAYVAAGLSIIPIAPRTKEPATGLLPRVLDEGSGKTRPSWRMFQERTPTDDELHGWFADGEAGIGIVCGAVSGGLLVVDLESVELYERWRELAAHIAGEELVERLPVVASGKGRHVYLRVAAPGGNRKLAMRGREVLAETRGEGGYIVAPPSVHPSGRRYELVLGQLTDIPVLEAGRALAILDAARALAPAEHPALSAAGGDVIGAYNSAHSIDEVLEAHGYIADRPGRYIRPGGDRGSVIIVDGHSIHFNPADPLYSEAPGGGNHAHTPFSAFCQLAHAGDVRAAVRAAARELGLSRDPDTFTPGPRDTTWPYSVEDGELWMHQQHGDGSPKAPLLLCNYVARITAETVLDDGESQEELYTLTAICQGRQRTLEMRRTEFESEAAVGRITAALGARARVNPRAQPRFILDAIKALSTEVEERLLYTHTGWVGGRYLAADGYVDAEGWHESDICQLPRRLQQYRLGPPDVPMSQALAIFDHMLTMAPENIVVPLVGAVLLSPILHALDVPAPMVHLNGPTGSHKTSIACAALALFGDATPAQPTDSWTSTANSIQRLGWHLKDMPLVLDDYKAANIKPTQVTFLLQNYGDNMARGRLDANSDMRATFPIRGVMLSSGEDQPDGEASILARILTVPVDRRSVHRGHLTAVQQAAPALKLVTVSYLTWLAGGIDQGRLRDRYHSIRATVLSQIEDALEHATNPGRIASNVAVLSIAWEEFGRFLNARSFWRPGRVRQWLERCDRALLNLARTQLDLTTQERYSAMFLETVYPCVRSAAGL